MDYLVGYVASSTDKREAFFWPRGQRLNSDKKFAIWHITIMRPERRQFIYATYIFA